MDKYTDPLTKRRTRFSRHGGAREGTAARGGLGKLRNREFSGGQRLVVFRIVIIKIVNYSEIIIVK